MLKKYLLFFSFFLSILAVAQSDGLYDRTIFTGRVDDPMVQQSIADLQHYLQAITGKDFTIKDEKDVSKNGIHLIWNRNGLLTGSLNSSLEKGSIEGFVLSGNSDRLLLVATHPLGFSRAVYTYLDLLGIKWYFPGSQWEFVPGKKDIRYLQSLYFTPSLILRDFFGTGGIRDMPPLDPKGNVKQQWADWRRRNRMGGEIDPAGHYGEVFNLKYKEILDKNPQFLAFIQGKRAPWNIVSKWCISNKDFRALFIRDRVEDLKLKLKTNNYPNEKILISVDPADGGGDCECDQCKKLGTPSDNSFFLANEVAKAVAQVSPRAIVNLYAYNTHATPPPFPLESNIMVQVIPYAFQNVGTPEEMLDKWRKRHSNLLIYDYYAIPDWHYEFPMPRKTSPDTLAGRIRYWQSKGVKGFTLESVYGFGNAGLGLYLMGRLGWDLNTDIYAVRDKFYRDMFGASAAVMKIYYEHHDNNYAGSSDLPYLQDLLMKAGKSADTEAGKRLVQLQAYLHYLYLFQRWQSSPAEQKDRAWEDVNRFVWEIYPMNVIHSTRIADLLYYNLDKTSPLLKEWSIVDPFGEKLKAIHFISSKDIKEWSQKDATRYPLLEDFVYGKGRPMKYQLNKSLPSLRDSSTALLFLYFPDSYIRGGAQGNFSFSIRLNATPSNNILFYPVTFTCVDTATGKTMISKTEQIGYSWKKISLNIPEGKTWKLSIKQEPWILLRFPNDQFIGFSSIPTYAMMEKIWFFIPSGTKYFYYSNSATEQPQFTDPLGKPMTPRKVNDLNMYQLDSRNKAGQWWSMTAAQYKFLQFYSKPDLFFTHPGYTVKEQ
jgi:hypothetical protein